MGDNGFINLSIFFIKNFNLSMSISDKKKKRKEKVSNIIRLSHVMFSLTICVVQYK